MQRVCAVCAVGANVAAGIVAAVTHDLTLTAVIGGITAASLAIVGSVKILAPALADGIKTIGPALAELQKQRDEIRRGSLSGQIEELKKQSAEQLERVRNDLTAQLDHARASLHRANNQAQVDAAAIDELREDLKAARAETHEAREELHGLREDLKAAHLENTRLMADIRRLQAAQGQQIRDNREAIAAGQAALAEVAATIKDVPLDHPTAPPRSGQMPRGAD